MRIRYCFVDGWMDLHQNSFGERKSRQCENEEGEQEEEE